MEFTRALVIASQASVSLPLIAGLVYYARLTPPLRILLGFVVFAAGVELGATWLTRVFHNNIPLLHLYSLVEGLVLFRIYHLHFSGNRHMKMFIRCALVFFTCAFLYDAYVLLGDPIHTNILVRTVECLALVVLALNYFYLFFKSDNETVVWKQPMFWVSAAILIYFSTNFLLFLMMDYLIRAQYPTADFGVNVHDVLNVIRYVLYAIAFRCTRHLTT